MKWTCGSRLAEIRLGLAIIILTTAYGFFSELDVAAFYGGCQPPLAGTFVPLKVLQAGKAGKLNNDRGELQPVYG